MKTRWLLLLVLALVLAACDTGGDQAGTGTGEGTPTDDAAEPGDEGAVTIRYGSIPTSGLTIGHVLDANPDDLELEGRGSAYELESTYFAGSPDIVQGLAAGTMDAGAVGATAIFPLFRQGVEVRIVGEYFEERSDFLTPSYLARAGSGIESVEDLRGRTVATNSVGSPIYWTAIGHLREHGMEAEEDYTIVAVPFPNMLDALDAGEVDAAPIIMPWLRPALDSGDYDVLFSDTDVQDPYVQSLLVFSKAFLDEHPDAAKAFIADWAASAEFVRDEANHASVVEAVAEITNTPAENLAYVATQDHYFFPERGAPNVEAIQQNWDWFHEVGGIDEPYDVEDYIDPEFRP